MGSEEGGRRSYHFPTLVSWGLALALVFLGMAFDARGWILPSILCFLAASAALVAPLVARRRRLSRLPAERTGNGPEDEAESSS